MKIGKLPAFVAGALTCTALSFSFQVSAQSWPVKPVRIIVPFGAGGGTDIQARLLGQHFNESMKQTFLVDNRSGAGGLIGAGGS